MAQTRKATSTTAKAGAFVCPECGFVAKHAMGLGRHRTSRHGVASKRELAGKATGRRRRTAAVAAPVQDVQVREDLARVEAKLDDVLQRLETLTTMARSEPPRRRRLGRG